MINSEALQRSYNTVRTKYDPHFEWIANESAPWTPLQQPLDQTAVALVGTCGAYHRGVDCPFDAENWYGDPSFKEIPISTPLGELIFAHTHFAHDHVDQDPQVAFPLVHMQQLQTEGVIGRFVNPAISFSGFLPQPQQLIMDTAPAAAKKLVEAGAQAALLVPC